MTYQICIYLVNVNKKYFTKLKHNGKRACPFYLILVGIPSSLPAFSFISSSRSNIRQDNLTKNYN